MDKKLSKPINIDNLNKLDLFEKLFDMVSSFSTTRSLTPAGFEAFKKAGKANKPDPRQQGLGI